MFNDRIILAQKYPKFIPAINLNENEYDLYHGCGDAIVYTKDGKIEKVIYLHNIDEDGAKDVVDEALAHNEVWLGMMSCYQFCNPQRLDGSNPILFARIMRLVAENLIDMTPNQFKEARRKLGLSASKMAAALSDPDGDSKPVHSRTIQRWEAGSRNISSPAIVAVYKMLREADC